MNSVMKELRERSERLRENIVQSIISYIERHGYPPTVREIGDMVGLKSTSSVQHHLKVLFKEGRLETDAGECSPRAIRIPGYKFVKVAE